MEFICKSCGKRENTPQGWLLAFELPKPGTEVRNMIFLTSVWDDEKARQGNALHFCSQQCQDKYLAKWHKHLAA